MAKERYLHDYVLELTFATGEVAAVDFADWVPTFGGMLEPLHDSKFFALARLEPEYGTVEWPGEIDFCPDVLYSKATGKPLPADERTAVPA